MTGPIVAGSLVLVVCKVKLDRSSSNRSQPRQIDRKESAWDKRLEAKPTHDSTVPRFSLLWTHISVRRSLK